MTQARPLANLQRDVEQNFKLYELIRTEKLANSTKYFQQLAIMITVVWGGFGLFATQSNPEADLAVFAVSVAWLVAMMFAG